MTRNRATHLARPSSALIPNGEPAKGDIKPSSLPTSQCGTEKVESMMAPSIRNLERLPSDTNLKTSHSEQLWKIGPREAGSAYAGRTLGA